MSNSLATGISLPTGTVTFLFTDIQGSTPLWESQPDLMAAALQVHNTALRGAIEAHGGVVFKTVGDAFQAAWVITQRYKGCMMLARIWRGRVPAEKTESYMQCLQATGIHDYQATEGNCGVFVLRCTEAGITEFLIMILWDSLEAIRRFAEPDPEKPVYYPEDEELLLEFEPKVVHYEVEAHF